MRTKLTVSSGMLEQKPEHCTSSSAWFLSSIVCFIYMANISSNLLDL